MGSGRESGSGIEELLQRLTEVLAHTGEQLRNGTFAADVSPEHAEGCPGSRPSFTVKAPSGNGGEPPPSFIIITPHAGEACTFADYLYGLFRPFLDECTEQDFFDRLTEAAVEYACYVEPSDATAVNLLKVMLAEAEEVARDMLSGEFPCAAPDLQR